MGRKHLYTMNSGGSSIPRTQKVSLDAGALRAWAENASDEELRWAAEEDPHDDHQHAVTLAACAELQRRSGNR